MIAGAYLILIAILAFQVQHRIVLLETLRGLPRYLCAFGLTLFLVNWANFLLYALVGWGLLYLGLSWGLILVSVCVLSGAWPRRIEARHDGFRSLLRQLPAIREWNFWFLFLATFVLARFYAGLDVDADNNVWSVFNFVDTGFHLSVVNAFLNAPHFPPGDLDVSPYPLKYHFLADFHVAHLVRLGLPALGAMWSMNLVSALVMVGSLWAVFDRWLRLPPRWVMLAGLVFLFLNPALINLVHFLTLHSAYFDAAAPFRGILWYPYFNFEFIVSNLLEPQRGFLFSMPIVLLVLHAIFGKAEAVGTGPSWPPSQVRLLQSFVLVCLLPFSHIVAFTVLAVCLGPALWPCRRWFLSQWRWWTPALGLGVLQLLYLGFYGPPTNLDYSSWGDATAQPLQEFGVFPASCRRVVFWLFVNGDFLFWGLLFAGLAWFRRPGTPTEPAAPNRLRSFLWRWRWYFATCLGCFVFINVRRYSFAWGDSNKFVLFLNLGLTLVIVLGAAQWLGQRWRVLSHVLWAFFFLLCVSPVAYAFYQSVITAEHGAVLLFETNSRKAADWMASSLNPADVVLTAANDSIHFVTPLAGRPTVAGIYADSNPYRQDERAEQIRRVYEDADFQMLSKLDVEYVCVSRNERRNYTLHPRWDWLMQTGTGVVFHVGGAPDDEYSVYVFDSHQLMAH